MRPRNLGAGAIVAGGVATAAALVACLDFSPLAYDDGAGDASAGDVTSDLGNIDALAGECATCIMTGPCASEQAACNANSKCAIFSACVTASYCWMSQLTDLSNLPPCVLACALKAGVSSQSDPGVALLAPIYTCAHDPTKCAAVCAPGTPAKDQ